MNDQFVPHLVVRDGMAALEFYRDVFGGEFGHNMMSPDGEKLIHGELLLDGHQLFVSDYIAPTDGGSLDSPDRLGGTCVRITLSVDDADTVFQKALARGCEVLMPVSDMFWGARYGKFRDPFGHEWGVNQQLADQSVEETQAQADKFFADRQSDS